jgi:cellulose synthase/poly-beta-1,6-N-acetylglucosamine synthase-like glycosyltransferase
LKTISRVGQMVRILRPWRRWFNDGAIRNQERSDYCPKVYGPKLNEARARGRGDAFPIAPNPLVSILVPFYNEQEVVWPFYRLITRLIDNYTEERFEILCVDDGRRDNTLACLQEVAAIDPRFRIIELSRNFGKEAALTAGIDAARR